MLIIKNAPSHDPHNHDDLERCKFPNL